MQDIAEQPEREIDRRRAGLAAVLVIVIAIGLVAAFEDHLFVQNLRVVERGAIYRGAEQKPWPLRRLIDRYQIRTIVCLAQPEPSEARIAESLGVRWVYLPITSGSANTTFDLLEQAAKILHDPTNQPAFFHCKRGIYRSNLEQAVYRMKECGWSFERSMEELHSGGFDPARSGGDACCEELLARYYRERIQGGSAPASIARHKTPIE